MAALTTPNECQFLPCLLIATPLTLKAAELMSSKPRCRHRPRRSDFPKRLRLGIYLDHPRRFPPSEVIGYNKSAVYVWDRHPKSTVHALLLPRDKSKRLMSPWEALKDKEFLAEMQAEAAKLKTLVAMELKSRFKDVSETDKLRAQYEKTVAAGEAYVGDVPVARNWEDEVKIGFHSVQTMKHLHFHVLSRDCIARTGPTHPGYYSERHYSITPPSSLLQTGTQT